MATQVRSPGSVATDVDTVGDADWSDASNALVDDANAATVVLNADSGPIDSYRIRFSNFGFTISDDATGITVRVRRQASTDGIISYTKVTLIDDEAGESGEDKFASVGAWEDSEQEDVFGSSVDTWTLNPTAAEINDPDFGVALRVFADGSSMDNITVSLFHVEIEVTYPNPGGGAADRGAGMCRGMCRGMTA